MPETRNNPEYILDSEEEPLRLERQARLYGSADDLRHMAPCPADRVLDAGCGSGSITRAIARAVPEGRATGVDREPKYVEFARRRAAAEAIANIQFEVADLLAGLVQIQVDFIPDRVLGGFGGDPEKRWNWQTQLQSAIGFGAKVFGSMERAESFNQRFVERFNRPDVYVYCPLFYVEGCVP